MGNRRPENKRSVRVELSKCVTLVMHPPPICTFNPQWQHEETKCEHVHHPGCVHVVCTHFRRLNSGGRSSSEACEDIGELPWSHLLSARKRPSNYIVRRFKSYTGPTFHADIYAHRRACKTYWPRLRVKGGC